MLAGNVRVLRWSDCSKTMSKAALGISSTERSGRALGKQFPNRDARPYETTPGPSRAPSQMRNRHGGEPWLRAGPRARLAAQLFAVEHLRCLCDEWRIGGDIPPRIEVDGVSQPVVQEAPPRCRFDITTLILSRPQGNLRGRGRVLLRASVAGQPARNRASRSASAVCFSRHTEYLPSRWSLSVR